MKVTVEIPKEYHALLEEALESGEYTSVEQILLDGLAVLSEAIESAEHLERVEQAEEEDLLGAMQARMKDDGDA